MVRDDKLHHVADKSSGALKQLMVRGEQDVCRRDRSNDQPAWTTSRLDNWIAAATSRRTEQLMTPLLMYFQWDGRTAVIDAR